MSWAIFCEIQHGRCEQRELADFAAMTSRETLYYNGLFSCCDHFGIEARFWWLSTEIAMSMPML